jgi:hypothetical protein
MPTFLDHMNEEIATFENALATDPRYLKLSALREARKHYLRDAALPAQEVERASPHTERRSSREMAPQRRRALEETEAFLTGKTSPVLTRDIFHQIVTVKGCEIGGRDPQNGLSAILSRSEKFIAHGRAGWTLAEVKSDATESETPNSSELFGAPKANGAEPLSP